MARRSPAVCTPRENTLPEQIRLAAASHRVTPRPDTWGNAGCRNYCTRSPYGRTPCSRSARHARRAPPCDIARSRSSPSFARGSHARIGSPPRRAVIAKDVRDLQRWSNHGCRRYAGGWTVWFVVRLFLGFFLRGCEQSIEWALDIGDHAGGDARVTRRRIQFVVTQKRLDHSNVGVALKQVGRKTVAHPLQRHSLPDPGRVGRLMEQARLSWRVVIGLPALMPGNSQRSCRGTPRIVSGINRPYLPPLLQQIEHLGRQHHVAVLAALRLLDPNDLLRAVDIA